MPETICRCFELFLLSYTGNTTRELVSTADPITTKRDVTNVESLGGSTVSPSSYRFTSGSHPCVVSMDADGLDARRRRIAELAVFTDAYKPW